MRGSSAWEALRRRAGEIVERIASSSSLCCGLILLLCLVFFYPLWTRRGIVYSKDSDIIAQHLSMKYIGQQSMAQEGQLALWDPATDCGSPALANPQSSYLFPFDLLYWILPVDLATNGVVLLDFLLAGIAMFICCRHFLKDRVAALFCGVAYMLGYRYLTHLHSGWLPLICMNSLVPLLFWSCDRLIERPSERWRLVCFSGIVALCLLQGGAQPLYYGSVACILFAIVRVVRLPRPDRLPACLHLSLGAILGVMLSAPVLLPRLEFTSLSTRLHPSYEFFAADPPTVFQLKTVVDPNDQSGLRGLFWEDNFYFGLWMYPLLAVAFAGGQWRRSLVLLLAAATMVFLCFDTPILRGLYHFFPGFKFFRITSRILALAQFVLTLLAGLGLRNLLRGRGIGLFSAAALVTGGLALLAALWLQVTALYAISLLVAAAGALSLLRQPFAAVAVGLTCLLPIVDSTIRLQPLLTTLPLDTACPRPAFHNLLNRKTMQGRVLPITWATVPYGMGGYYEIDLVNGYPSMVLRHYDEYLAVLQFGARPGPLKSPEVITQLSPPIRPDMLRALDVRYILANQRLPMERFGYRHFASIENVPVFEFFRGLVRVPVEIWKSDNILGPAYFATSVSPVRDEAESLDALVAARSVLQANVLGLQHIPSGLDYSGGSVSLLRRGINRYEYQVESRGGNFLILSQIWYPGWRATLDGRPLELYRTNHALIGCFVPPGDHRLRLEMTSPLLRYGTCLALAAIVLLSVFCGRAALWQFGRGCRQRLRLRSG